MLTHYGVKRPTKIEVELSDKECRQGWPGCIAVDIEPAGEVTRSQVFKGIKLLAKAGDEARQFTGMTGTFTLSYEYFLSGAVKKVSDISSGSSVSTTLDNVGRPTGVSAERPATGVIPFVSQAIYRASGAPKSVNYGNSTSLSVGYNTRGALSSLQLTGVKDANLAPVTYSRSYQHHADGNIKFAQDAGSTNSIKDRAFQYDHAGRLKEAYSGTQARDYVNNTNAGIPDGPYRQTSTYDAWDNALSEGRRFWSRDVVETHTIDQFNRNQGWTYDAEANVISQNQYFGDSFPAQNRYDAAGRRLSVTQSRPCIAEPQHLTQVHIYTNTNTQIFDGEGQVASYEQSRKIGINGTAMTGKTLYLRSSVMGGRVISEYDGSGSPAMWTKTYVYAGGERVGSMSLEGASSTRIAGIDKSIVDSQQFTNPIQEHCRKSGYSNSIVIQR